MYSGGYTGKMLRVNLTDKTFREEPPPEGPSKGQMISQKDLDFMLDEYYDCRGWTRDGVPTRAKLEELHVGYAADDLRL